MNNLVLQFNDPDLSHIITTLTTPLLDMGAEFANFVNSSKTRQLRHGEASILMEHASHGGFRDGKLKPAPYFPSR